MSDQLTCIDCEKVWERPAARCPTCATFRRKTALTPATQAVADLIEANPNIPRLLEAAASNRAAIRHAIGALRNGHPSEALAVLEETL